MPLRNSRCQISSNFVAPEFMREYVAPPINGYSREAPFTSYISIAPARLVSRASPRITVARKPRFLSRLGSRNHAAANAHRRRDSLLRPLPPPLPRRSCTRARPPVGGLEILVRPRLLQPRSQFTRRREDNRRTAQQRIPAGPQDCAEPARNRALHSRCSIK